MENRRGVLSHFGGIIRIIILIVSVAVITFFIVRFFRNREATRTAQQSTQVAQNQGKHNTSDESRSDDSTDHESDNTESSNSSESVAIPSGVAEGGDGDETSVLPAVGMGYEAVLVSVLAGLVTYGVVFRTGLQKRSEMV
jgi:cytoskeletal protein RodZ